MSIRPSASGEPKKKFRRITPQKVDCAYSEGNLLSDDLCETFNEIGATCDFNITKKLDSLEQNVPHVIIKARPVETRFGRKILLDLKDGFSVFLPSRFSCLDDESVHKLGCENYSVIYEGLQTVRSDVSFHKVQLQINNN